MTTNSLKGALESTDSGLFDYYYESLREMAKLPPTSLLTSLEAGPWNRPTRDLAGIAADLHSWWVFRALQVAAKNGSFEDCKTLLCFVLKQFGIELPKGVIVASPGKPGRPRKQSERDLVIQRWSLLGKPGPNTKALACAVYGQQYYRVGASERKKLRDRCGRIIRGHLRAVSASDKIRGN